MSVVDHIKEIVKHSKMGNTVVLGSYPDVPEGMVGGHAYTLQQCFEVDKKVIFKIRNPWGSV